MKQIVKKVEYSAATASKTSAKSCGGNLYWLELLVDDEDCHGDGALPTNNHLNIVQLLKREATKKVLYLWPCHLEGEGGKGTAIKLKGGGRSGLNGTA